MPALGWKDECQKLPCIPGSVVRVVFRFWRIFITVAMGNAATCALSASRSPRVCGFLIIPLCVMMSVLPLRTRVPRVSHRTIFFHLCMNEISVKRPIVSVFSRLFVVLLLFESYVWKSVSGVCFSVPCSRPFARTHGTI